MYVYNHHKKHLQEISYGYGCKNERENVWLLREKPETEGNATTTHQQTAKMMSEKELLI